MPGAQYYDGKKIILPTTDDSAISLYNHWIHQGISSLISIYGTERAKEFPAEHNVYFQKCSNASTSVMKHAKCFVKMLSIPKENLKETFALRRFKTDYSEPPPSANKYLSDANTSGTLKKQMISWIGSFGVQSNRVKRSRKFSNISHAIPCESLNGKGKKCIKNRNGYKNKYQKNYNLLTEYSNRSMIGIITKTIHKTMNLLRGRGKPKPWRQLIGTVQNLKLKKEKKKKRELDKPLNRFLEQRLGGHGAMNPISSRSKERFRTFMKFVREGVELGMMAVTSKKVDNFKNRTLKLFSPRFLSVMPESNDDEANIFSPSLFSVHGQGVGLEHEMGLSNFLKGMMSSDRNDIMDLVLDAAGVDEQIQKANKSLNGDDFMEMKNGIDGQPLYFTRENVTEMYGEIESQKIDTLQGLYQSLTSEQVIQMNKTGLASLSLPQLQNLYGPSSPYHHSVALKRLTKIAERNDFESYLENDLLALSKASQFGMRDDMIVNKSRKKRDIVNSPFAFTTFIKKGSAISTPIILSPIIFSPIVLSPAIFGPFILSPWAFNPLILSPRLFAPFIVNPLMFTPIILSPLAFHPFILSPGIFNPIVLTPLAFSPLILSPQVFTPIILSPMVLNPLILTPMVASPLILSPFAASPLILSPQFYTSIILSPYFLSPLIYSNLTASEVILSPSALS